MKTVAWVVTAVAFRTGALWVADRTDGPATPVLVGVLAVACFD